jgi:murein L,D-transpeptidase YcbB/YkuD
MLIWSAIGAARGERAPGAVCRAVVAAVTVALIALAASSRGAGAQSGNWWEGIQGFGSPDYSGKARQSERQPLKPDTLNDLRPDDIPWRSDEMVDQIDKAIARYERILSKGGWPIIPGTRTMRPGDGDERVPALRRRLRVTGELAANSGTFDDYEFDQVLEAAVTHFQERNGLRPTGRVDQPTLAALNFTAEQRLDQLRLNRNRIVELLQQPLEERYVLVNVPAFQLEAVERYQVEQRHRVIVGRAERPTPSLRAMIKAINFFPYWKVPDSVAQLDVIPRLQKEPEYLEKEQIRVISGDFNGPELDATAIDWSQADATKIKFRQDPGPQNALGLVRIDMQNPEGVYMHDTPMKPLFQQRVRPFSAGCVRVQDVFKLVEWIMRYEPGWENPGQVEAVLQSGQALDLNLTRPVPVYFTYITAWAERTGEVHFRTDIYNRDGKPAADAFDPDAPPPPAQGLAP